MPTEPNSAVIRDGEPASEQVESGSTEDGRELLDPLAAVVTVESETTRLPHEPGRALVLAAPAPGLGIPGRDLQRSRAPRRRATVRLTQARLTVAGLVVLLLAGGLLTGYVVRVNEARPQVFLPSPSSTSASLVPAPSSERVQAPISPGPGVVSPTDMPGSSAGAGGETASSAASAEVPATTAVSPGTPAAAGSGAAPATASPPTPSATAAAPLEAFSPALCDSPPPGGLPVTPQKGAPRGVNGWTLQAGWSYFNDGAGFHLAVPDGWTYQRIGTTYCFRSPRNARVMSLDAGRDPAADPLAASRAEERRLAESAALPGYALVGVAPVPLLHKAADWEYRYRSRTGAARHTGVRWFVVAGRAYALGWSTPEKSWATDLSKIQMIRSTFYSDRPAPGPDRSTPSS